MKTQWFKICVCGGEGNNKMLKCEMDGQIISIPELYGIAKC